MRFEILGPLVKTLTANGEYFRSKKENSPLPIQIKVSKKLKTYLRVFCALLKYTLNLKQYEKK